MRSEHRTRRLVTAIGACVAASLLAPAAVGADDGGNRAKLIGPVPESSGKGPAPPYLPDDVAERYDYVEEEYFVRGDATSYLPVGQLGTDGRWKVEPAGDAPYVTRIKVRRPKDLDEFSGNVAVEWVNVTGGIDVDADIGLTYPVLAAKGDVGIAVSAQAVSVNEGPGLDLGLPGSPPPGSTLPLKSRDPQRYADLMHPGDDYSYDIVTQVADLARTGDLTKGEKPKHITLMGESQSAGRLVTYANAVQPLTDAYDGILIHSRNATGAVINSATGDQQPEVVMIRSDLDIPVLQYETEGDVSGTGQYVTARQPNTRRLVTWEVAGTAHADDAIVEAGERSTGVTSFDIIAVCGASANTGPHAEVLRGAYDAFRTWVATGKQPPRPQPLETDGTELVRDADDNALGGVRTPDVDAPTASLLSVHQSDNRICRLFGQTVPLSTERLAELYPTHADYVTAVTKAADSALRKGFIIEQDRDAYVAAAKQASVPG